MSSNVVNCKIENISNKYKALTSVNYHQHHITFSQSMTIEIKKSVTDAITSIESLDYSNKDSDKTILFSEVIVFLRDINSVLFDLQVIYLHLHEDNITKNSLLNVINQLEDVSENVRNGYNAKLNVLEVKLKDGLKQIETVSQNLLKIIAIAEHYEFKQELVDMLSDLLSAADRVKIRNEIRTCSKVELDLYYENAKNEVLKAIKSFKAHNETVLCCMIHHVQRGTQHMLKVVHHLQKYGCHYEPKVCKAIEDATNSLQDTLRNLQLSFRSCDTVERIVVKFEEGLSNGYGNLAKLLEFLDDAYGKGYSNLKESVIYVTVETFVNGFQLHRGLLDAIRLADSSYQSN